MGTLLVVLNLSVMHSLLSQHYYFYFNIQVLRVHFANIIPSRVRLIEVVAAEANNGTDVPSDPLQDISLETH